MLRPSGSRSTSPVLAPRVSDADAADRRQGPSLFLQQGGSGNCVIVNAALPPESPSLVPSDASNASSSRSSQSVQSGGVLRDGNGRRSPSPLQLDASVASVDSNQDKSRRNSSCDARSIANQIESPVLSPSASRRSSFAAGGFLRSSFFSPISVAANAVLHKGGWNIFHTAMAGTEAVRRLSMSMVRDEAVPSTEIPGTSDSHLVQNVVANTSAGQEAMVHIAHAEALVAQIDALDKIMADDDGSSITRQIEFNQQITDLSIRVINLYLQDVSATQDLNHKIELYRKAKAIYESAPTPFGDGLENELGQLCNTLTQLLSQVGEIQTQANNVAHSVEQKAVLLSQYATLLAHLLPSDMVDAAWIKSAEAHMAVGDSQSAAQAYVKAWKYKEAAVEFAKIGQFENVARCYLRSDDYVQAALMFSQAKQDEKAAQCYARNGDFEKAASLFSSIGQDEKAADNFLRAAEQAVDEAGRVTEMQQALEGALVHSSLAVQHYQAAGMLDNAAKVSLLKANTHLRLFDLQYNNDGLNAVVEQATQDNVAAKTSEYMQKAKNMLTDVLASFTDAQSYAQQSSNQRGLLEIREQLVEISCMVSRCYARC